jgi:hypothetical protein
MLVKAEVIKRESDDGVSFLYDEVEIGHIYLVEPDSISDMYWFDMKTGKTTARQSIRVHGSSTGNNPSDGIMPLELLRIVPDA